MLLLSHFSCVLPQRRQPTRPRRPCDSPGKNTGVCCHFLLQCIKVKSESEVAQSCPTLHNPKDFTHQAPPSMGFSRQEYWEPDYLGSNSSSVNLVALQIWGSYYLSSLHLSFLICWMRVTVPVNKVHGILQARILEWVAFPFSRGSSQPRDQTQVSWIAGGFFTSWATREALFSATHCQLWLF